jgi:hypothetical protein
VRGLLVLALALLLLYGVATLLGLREHVVVLAGTYPSAGAGAAGALYVVLHLAATALAPVLLLAAGLVALAGRWLRRSGR